MNEYDKKEIEILIIIYNEKIDQLIEEILKEILKEKLDISE